MTRLAVRPAGCKPPLHIPTTLYRARRNDVSRVLTRGHVNASGPFQLQRDPHHIVTGRKRVCVCGGGKTSERMIPNDEANEAKVVTNFNQFGRIMSLNQADMRRDQKADPNGTHLEIGNVSWPRTEKTQLSAGPSLKFGSL